VAASREAVEEARLALHRAALRALIGVAGDADRERTLVRSLYWDVPELPVKTIEVVVGGPAEVRARAGPGPLLGRGDMGDVEGHATSRTHLATGTPRCKPCDRKRKPASPTLPPNPWDEDAFPLEPPEWDELDDDEPW
jgi:hypothetical protein